MADEPLIQPATLDVITEIPEEIHFKCPELVQQRDAQGNVVLVPCGADCRAFPKTKAVQHATPPCDSWAKNSRSKEWVSNYLVKADVAVRFAPADANYHGKPR